MGTHIDSFFPRTVDRSVPAILERLSMVFGGLVHELAAIRERGRFSQERGDWWLVADEGTIFGEGPSGFSISVYSQVVEFSSVERFGVLEFLDFGLRESLRRVFAAVASSLGSGSELAVASGGFGDTDKAGALAAEGASFEVVCRCLEIVIGPPARCWEALESGASRWYLSRPAAPGTSISDSVQEDR